MGPLKLDLLNEPMVLRFYLQPKFQLSLCFWDILHQLPKSGNGALPATPAGTGLQTEGRICPRVCSLPLDFETARGKILPPAFIMLKGLGFGKRDFRTRDKLHLICKAFCSRNCLLGCSLPSSLALFQLYYAEYNMIIQCDNRCFSMVGPLAQ